MKIEPFFKKSKDYLIPGYMIPVRNEWNFQIECVFINDKEKEIYEQTLGEKLLSENEFEEWRNNLKQQQKLK